MSACRPRRGKSNRTCGAGATGSCGGGGGGDDRPAGLAEIVAAYVARDADRSAEELAFFSDRSQTLRSAIRRAAGSRLESGTMHPHQYRVGQAACSGLAASLVEQAELIERATDFAAIHDIVRHAASGMDRIGELTIYDVAHRIAAYRGLNPEHVYLHRGTREGARALGLKVNRRYLAVGELPAELQLLTAAQLEDLLCLYKADLDRAARP